MARLARFAIARVRFTALVLIAVTAASIIVARFNMTRI